MAYMGKLRHRALRAPPRVSQCMGVPTPGPTSPDPLWLGELGVGLCHFLFCQVTLWGGWLGASVRVDV